MSEPWTPYRLLETSCSYWQGCALQAAVRLEIFTHLSDASLSAEALAGLLDYHPRSVAMLLRALTAMGLLVKDQAGYHCPEPIRYWLDRNSSQYLGHSIRHHHQLMSAWHDLDQTIRDGNPQSIAMTESDEEWRTDFLLGMHNLSSLLAPQVVPLLELGNPQTLLDIGGGVGTWAINFCLRYQNLQATVFDLPTSEALAVRTLAHVGMSERVSFVGGDFLRDRLGDGFDLVWLSHILHSEGPDQAEFLVRRAAGTLAAGGQLLIHEFILDDHGDSPLFPALFSLNMLLGTETGQSYCEGELFHMCQAAGLSDIRRIELPTEIHSGIIAARKS